MEGVAHALLQERGLQATPAQLWDSGRTAEERHAVMNTEHAGSARFAVQLGQEAQTLARGRNRAGLQEKIQKFRMFVGPTSGIRVGPELRLRRARDPYSDIGPAFARGFLDGPVQDIADLNGPVIAIAQQLNGCDTNQRTHFVPHRRASVEKEALEPIEGGGAELLEDTQPECLSDG